MTEGFSALERLKAIFPGEPGKGLANRPDSRKHEQRKSGLVDVLKTPKRKFYRSVLGVLITEVRERQTEQKRIENWINADNSKDEDGHLDEGVFNETFFRGQLPRGWYRNVFSKIEPFDEASNQICATAVRAGKSIFLPEKDRVSYEIFINKNKRLLELLLPSESWSQSYKVIRPLELMLKQEAEIDAIFEKLPTSGWVSISHLLKSASVDPPLKLVQQIIRWTELQNSHHQENRNSTIGLCADLDCEKTKSVQDTKMFEEFKTPWKPNLKIHKTTSRFRVQSSEPVEMFSNGKHLGTYSMTNLPWMFSGKHLLIKTRQLEVEINRTFPNKNRIAGNTTLVDKLSGHQHLMDGSIARAWASPDGGILLFLSRAGEFIRVDAPSGLQVMTQIQPNLGDLYFVEVAFGSSVGSMLVYSKRGHFTVFEANTHPRSFVLNFFPRDYWPEIESLSNTAGPEDAEEDSPTIIVQSIGTQIYSFEIYERLRRLGITSGIKKLRDTLNILGITDSKMLLRQGLADELLQRGVSKTVVDGLSWSLHYFASRAMDPLEINGRRELAMLSSLGWPSIQVNRSLRTVPATRLRDLSDTESSAFSIDYVSANATGWTIYFDEGFHLGLSITGTPECLGVPFLGNLLFAEDQLSLNLNDYKLDPKAVELLKEYSKCLL